MKYIYLLT